MLYAARSSKFQNSKSYRSMNLFDLSGKRALITGGTHGLGMAIATGLAQAGAHLLINGHTPEKMEQALAGYKTLGFNSQGYLFDVTNNEAVKDNIDRIEKEHGSVDILINNAGIIKRVAALDMDVADFRQVIDIDLVAPFIVSQHV